jgi:hypothetical protein
LVSVPVNILFTLVPKIDCSTIHACTLSLPV